MVEWRAKRREEGTAVVEAAVTLLLFFVVLFSVMEGSRFLNVQHTLTAAAREGARFAVAPLTQTSTLPSDGEIEAVVNQFLDAASIQGATISVERPVEVPVGATPIVCTRVRVSLPYGVLTLALFDVLEVTLTGEALMRNETSP